MGSLIGYYCEEGKPSNSGLQEHGPKGFGTMMFATLKALNMTPMVRSILRMKGHLVEEIFEYKFVVIDYNCYDDRTIPGPIDEAEIEAEVSRRRILVLIPSA